MGNRITAPLPGWNVRGYSYAELTPNGERHPGLDLNVGYGDDDLGMPEMPIGYWGGRLNPQAQGVRYGDPYTLLWVMEGVDLSLESPDLAQRLAAAEETMTAVRADREYNFRLKMEMEAFIRRIEGTRPRVRRGAADALIAAVAKWRSGRGETFMVQVLEERGLPREIGVAPGAETSDREVPVETHTPHVVGDSASERFDASGVGTPLLECLPCHYASALDALPQLGGSILS